MDGCLQICQPRTNTQPGSQMLSRLAIRYRPAKIGAASILVLGAISGGSPAARAGTFDVKTPDVSAGETEAGLNASVFRGYPVNAELLRHSWEASISRGLTNWWAASLKANLDQPIGDNFRTSTVGTEHLFVLRKLEGGVGLGWYTAVDVAVASDQTNTLTFGPIVQFGSEKTSLTLNPFLSQTFGRNREDGIALSYGWQAKHEIREGVAVGLEGYGSIKNLGQSPGLDFQEHRIGPVLYFERPIGSKSPAASTGNGGGDGPTFKLETGVLFGLTAGTQDTAIKVKAGVTF